MSYANMQVQFTANTLSLGKQPAQNELVARETAQKAKANAARAGSPGLIPDTT